jgi:hypothetical protein
MSNDVTEQQIIELYNEFKERYTQVPEYEHMEIVTVALHYMTVEQVKKWYETTVPNMTDESKKLLMHDPHLIMHLEAMHYFGEEKKDDYVPLAERGKTAPVTSGPMTQ